MTTTDGEPQNTARNMTEAGGIGLHAGTGGQGGFGKSAPPTSSTTSTDPAGGAPPTDPLQLALAQFKTAWATVATCSTCEVALPALRHAATTGRAVKDILSEQESPKALVAKFTDCIDRIDQEIEKVQARLELAVELELCIEKIRTDIDASSITPPKTPNTPEFNN